DIDGVFANIDKCTPKLRENLRSHEAQVRRNAECTPLVRDLDLDVSVDELKMGRWDDEEVRTLFGFLEFRTLYDRLREAVGGDGAQPAPAHAEPLDVDVTVVRDAAEAGRVLRELAETEGALPVAGAWAGLEGRSELLGLALATAPARAVWLDAGVLADEGVRDTLRDLLAEGGRPVQAHGVKELLRALDRLGVDIRAIDLDTAVAAYLVDPAESQYVLDDLALRYAGVELRSPDAASPGQLDLAGSGGDRADDTGRRAVAVARLAAPLGQALDARGLSHLY